MREQQSSPKMLLVLLLLSVFVSQCDSADCRDRTYTNKSGYLVHNKAYNGGCSSKNYDIVLSDPSIVIELDWKDFFMDGSMPYCLSESVKVFTG